MTTWCACRPPALRCRFAALRSALCVALLAAVGAPAGAQAATFYLSPTGDDAASGTSSGSPWRSLARASNAVLRPGDHVLLEGEASFDGSLTLDAADAGDATAPVVVGSYGGGRATIRPASGAGVNLYNT
ncbi:MAG: hypothetical protein M3P40_03235, partial [Actinomycetota bacterium]|nr:hypothetical protein [Actinomycetota bacterium]